MWSMCESNFTTMSFKYAPTAEQNLQRLNGFVTAIQRYYYMYSSSKRKKSPTPQPVTDELQVAIMPDPEEVGTVVTAR